MTWLGSCRANEPQLLAYHVYFNDDRTRMSVVLHINPDSASLARHMKCSLAGELLAPPMPLARAGAVSGCCVS
jgi:hypothetical protein